MEKLKQLLNAAGVKSYWDLNDFERQEYDQMKTSLQGRTLTDRDVMNYIEEQIRRLTSKIITPDLTSKQENFYKAELSMFLKLQIFLISPIIERERAATQIDANIERIQSGNIT